MRLIIVALLRIRDVFAAATAMLARPFVGLIAKANAAYHARRRNLS